MAIISGVAGKGTGGLFEQLEAQGKIKRKGMAESVPAGAAQPSAAAQFLSSSPGDALYDRFPKVPSATESGRQVGVVPPAEQPPGKHFGAATLSSTGEPVVVLSAEEIHAAQDRSEPTGQILQSDESVTPVRPSASFEVPERPVEQIVRVRPASQEKTPRPPAVEVKARTKRVSLSFEHGVYTLPCLDVVVNTDGIAILLRLSDDSGTFVPAAGSRLTVSIGTQSWKCFCPGLCFELPGQGITVVALMHDRNVPEKAGE